MCTRPASEGPGTASLTAGDLSKFLCFFEPPFPHLFLGLVGWIHRFKLLGNGFPGTEHCRFPDQNTEMGTTKANTNPFVLYALASLL